MALRFIRLDYAFRAVIELYDIETISEYIYKFDLVDRDFIFESDLKEKEDLLYKTVNLLSEEIEQVALSYSGNAFHYFFNLLNDVVKSEGIAEVDFDKIRNNIQYHNKHILATKTTEDFDTDWGKPLLINENYVEKYSMLAGGAINYFKGLIEPHLRLYNEGKLIPYSPIQYQQPAIHPIKALLEAPKTERPKLKTSLNQKQLAYLFKLLSELKQDIFILNSDAELYRFIARNFITKGNNKEDLSEDKIRILFGEKQLDNKVIDFWQTHLNTMLDRTRKHKL